MSITDELRHSIEEAEQVYGCECKHLLALADRIDAEYEKAVCEAYAKGMGTAKTMTEGMVELPKDADDVSWNVGDRDEDGNTVTQLRLTSAGWYVITDGNWPYRPKHKHHRHVPTVKDVPTVEDVLRKFTDAILEWSGKSGTVAEVGTWSDVAAKYAAKLQLKED